MVSTAAAMAFCLLGTLGNGDPLVYPLGRVSTGTILRGQDHQGREIVLQGPVGSMEGAFEKRKLG